MIKKKVPKIIKISLMKDYTEDLEQALHSSPVSWTYFLDQGEKLGETGTGDAFIFCPHFWAFKGQLW